MGTRGCWGFRIDQADKLTYNHFDSYPDGLGNDLVKAVTDELHTHGKDNFRDLVKALRLVTEDTPPTNDDIAKLMPFWDPSGWRQTPNEWYGLLRETQGDLERTLASGVMIDSHQFMCDSMFCEYAYIVNLDTDQFEVYGGFQHNKHDKGRYSQLPGSNGYFPVALVAEFPLAAIPDNWEEIAFPPAAEDEDA